MRRTKIVILAGLFAVIALRCGGKKETASGGTASPSGGGASAPAASTNKDVYVDKYKIGRTQAGDGSASTESDTYVPGETVYMSFELRNLPSPSKVRIVFTSLANSQKVGELEKTTGKDGFVSFEEKDTKNWKPGTYRAEYLLVTEGEKPRGMGTHDFKMVASR